MNWRCILGHDRVYDYKNYNVYCKRCDKGFHDSATLFVMTTTIEKWDEYKRGNAEKWEVIHFIEYMWDEVPWERKYVDENGNTIE